MYIALFIPFHIAQSHSQAMWSGNETSSYSENLGEQWVDAAIVQWKQQLPFFLKQKNKHHWHYKPQFVISIPCRPFLWSTLLALLPGPLTFRPLQILCCWHVKSKKEWPGIRTYFRALLCIWWTCRAQWSFPPASRSPDEQQQGWCCYQFWKWEGTRSQRQASSQWHTQFHLGVCQSTICTCMYMQWCGAYREFAPRGFHCSILMQSL